jgi:hypothetical protein
MDHITSYLLFLAVNKYALTGMIDMPYMPLTQHPNSRDATKFDTTPDECRIQQLIYIIYQSTASKIHPNLL